MNQLALDDSSSYLVYCGLHYSRCPVEVREQFAREFVNVSDFRRLKEMFEKAVGHAIEMVPISTCNRFDLCILGNVSKRVIVDVFKECCAQLKLVDDVIRIAFDDGAFQMLCRIASSLDSLVLGETHILGQLKQSYQSAHEEALCGSEAAAIFTRCFQIAKRVRSETSLGHRSISVGHAAVDLARRVVNDLGNARVLVVGAGEMGRLTAQHFLSCGATDLTVANRNFEKARFLANDLNGAQALSLSDAIEALGTFDIVVTATSAGQDIIQFEDFKKAKPSRNGHVAVFVDISVPRNVDPNIGRLDDVFVFNVDDLDKIMNENRAARSAAAADAERIIGDELNLFTGVRKQRESLVQVGRFHAYVRDLVKTEIEKNTRQGLRDLNIDVVANAVAKKLVTPVASMAKADVRVEGHVGAAVDHIFQLSEKKHHDKH